MNIQRPGAKTDTQIQRIQAGRPGETRAADKAAQPAGEADQVSLSRTAQEALALKARMDSLPEARSEKLARLKAEIEAGTYRVDAGKVADKMLKARVLDQ